VTEKSDVGVVRLNGVRLDESHAQEQPQSQPGPGAPRRPRASAGAKRPIPSRPEPGSALRPESASAGENGSTNGAATNGTGTNGTGTNGAANARASQPSSSSSGKASAGSGARPRKALPKPEKIQKPDSVADGDDLAANSAQATESEASSASEAEAEADAEAETEADDASAPSAPARPRFDMIDTVGRLIGGGDWERRASRGLAFLRRRVTGDYEIDEFGFDRELTENVLLSLFRPLYERYFRVETRGLERVPDKGGVLIVANHSGTLPLDAIMTQIALADHHPAHRNLRMLAADVVFTMPFVGELARKAGHTLACNPDAERLLTAGEVVGVWPEGFKGIGKPFADRYRLQRFGRGGFVSAALRTGTPIVPTAIVGAEEIYPKIGDIKPLARLLGVPYVPVTPTFPWLGPLGLIPLPSKWYIAFGEPIDTSAYDPGSADDPMLVFNLTDQVRETIQDTLYRLLLQRRSVFF
jgi:1-acyl-sn-glycerol-3-phosphate acyltransferase